MADVTLIAEPRTEIGSGPAGRYRTAGQVPAVVYGLGSDTLSVTVPSRELEHALHSESGANTLITLKVDGGDVLALARQIQRHPTRGDLIHVDFVRVRRDTAVAAEVALHIVGEAPGAKQGGKFEQILFALSIEAKPDAIPTAIEVDVSGLDLGDQIKVSDLSVPAGVAIVNDPDALVAQVAIPRGAGTGEGEGEGEEGGAAAADEGASAEG